MELLLSAIANKKFQLSNLDPGLALGRAYLFLFFLNLPMGRHAFSPRFRVGI